MSHSRVIITATFAAGLIMFLTEAVTYSVFGGVYSEFMGKMLNTGFIPFYALKLFAVNIIIGFFVAAVFDSIYAGLPGGFLRKGINFAFVLWGIQTLPFALKISISTGADRSLFWLFMFQYLVSAVIVSFAMAGIFGEYKASLEKNREPIKKEPEAGPRTEEAKNEADKKNCPDIPAD